MKIEKLVEQMPEVTDEYSSPEVVVLPTWGVLNIEMRKCNCQASDDNPYSQ